VKILIVAKFWDSSAGIGALRPMKIAKYLIKAGHDVAVVCGDEYAGFDFFESQRLDESYKPRYFQLPAFSYSGIVAKEDRLYKRRNDAKAVCASSSQNSATDTLEKPKKQSLLNKLKWLLYKTLYSSFKISNTVKCSLKAIDQKLPFEPDIIFSSFAPEEVHFLAMKLKKMYPHAFWIADFRDPMANALTQSPLEYSYKLYRQKKVFAKADAVTVVSQTWRDEFASLGAKNAITLYSGFDTDDFADLKQASPCDGKLTFAYTGSLYPGLSDLTPFFEALNELFIEGAIDPAKIRLVYAGAHGAEFDSQSSSLPKEVEIINHGLVSRKESISLLMHSDILLHALFCYPETRGIITGKLGEYWASGKPVLAIITGTARADEFISILEKSGTGFSYDGTCHDKSFTELKKHIIHQYQRKMNDIELVYKKNDDFIEVFNYIKIAERLISFEKSRHPEKTIF